ncbi:hypothetical protein [Paenarthrobacter nitroguajacolicus]|uniref:hypothetical protein n=1 Tax=Paenarthrobacter nitroguajacolicus TaxID=211146 RepID=UPI00248AF165|nr:hypothetical protein [Paenarthrobacter nitroguajacolicus]MDI2036789.1 hypothetical protein [Paenarthrobacter nitroguajacolicus]
MGGSMYQAANEDPELGAVRRRRAWLAKEFGQFASGFSHAASGPLSVSGPSQVEAGLRVVARFEHPPVEGEPRLPAQCLITLKPTPGPPLHTSSLVNLLAKELAQFALGQMVAKDPADLLGSLTGVSAQASTIGINGLSTEVWSLEIPEVRGIVTGSRDRITCGSLLKPRQCPRSW